MSLSTAIWMLLHHIMHQLKEDRWLHYEPVISTHLELAKISGQPSCLISCWASSLACVWGLAVFWRFQLQFANLVFIAPANMGFSRCADEHTIQLSVAAGPNYRKSLISAACSQHSTTYLIIVSSSLETASNLGGISF